jgi:hypothetical protein
MSTKPHLFFESRVLGATFAFSPILDKKLKTITIDNAASLMAYPVGTIFSTSYENLEVIDSACKIKDTDKIVPFMSKDKVLVNDMVVHVNEMVENYLEQWHKTVKPEDDELRNRAKIFGTLYKKDIEDLICPPDKRAKPGMGAMKKTLEDSYKVPSIEDTGFHINKDDWHVIIRNALRQENTLLTGPTGLIY